MTISALVLPDGRRVDLDDDIVLGRAPIAPASSPAARTVGLSAPTVSKTHALIGQDATGVWMVDLHSSNGSEVLDAVGSSERAIPGARTAVPAGSLIRVGTDTIITVDTGAAASDDDWDRTMVVRPAAPPGPPPSSIVPPQPPLFPPPVSPAGINAFAPQAESGGGRSVAHFVGATMLLVWSAVGFAAQRDWVPDVVRDIADDRLLDFFVVPDRVSLRFFEFFAVASLPDSLGFLARGADIGPIVAIAVAVVALIAPKRAVRWVLVVLVAIPLFLLVGLLVTFLSDSFDFVIDDLDRFVPWFVLPVVGLVLLLWPSGGSAPAPAPPRDLFYAPEQPPAPSFGGPGVPPTS